MGNQHFVSGFLNECPFYLCFGEVHRAWVISDNLELELGAKILEEEDPHKGPSSNTVILPTKTNVRSLEQPGLRAGLNGRK